MKNQILFTASTTAQDTDTRTFQGTAVPYGEVTRDDRQITIAPGTFGNVDDLALVAVMVNHPFSKGEKAVRVGRVTEWRDSETGLEFTAKLNDSEYADEIYAALQSGDITEVSVAVYVNEENEDEFTSAEILEISLMVDAESAFAGSTISAVFSAESAVENVSTQTTNKETKHMENENYVDVAEFETFKSDIERDIARVADSVTPSEPTESRFESFGSLVKAIADGDDEAHAEYLAYAGGTSADTAIRPSWVKDALKHVEGKRPVTDFFSKEALPAEGMKVQYLKNGTDTTSVTKQATEGLTLANGKLTLTSADADIDTYGGYVEWTLQQIQRSPINIIEEGYNALARRYAQVTEAVSVTRLSAAGTSVSGFNPADYADIVDAVVDASVAFDSNGNTLDGVLVSASTFKKIAKIEINGSYVFSRSNGTLSIPGLSGDVFGVPMLLVPGLVGDVFTVADKDAIRTWEEGPSRLQDSNVLNLSSQFSLFGFMAQAVTDPTGIIRYTV